jgi:hypothetical protein
VLVKQKNERNKKEVSILAFIFKDLTFFKELGKDINEDTLKHLYQIIGLEELNSSEIVFNIGEIGSKFYVIL